MCQNARYRSQISVIQWVKLKGPQSRHARVLVYTIQIDFGNFSDHELIPAAHGLRSFELVYRAPVIGFRGTPRSMLANLGAKTHGPA